MRIVCHQQKTPDGYPTAEWIEWRLGRVTGSGIGNAMSKLQRASKNGAKGDWSGKHWDYVKDLAWEHITRVPTDHYVSKPMEVGAQYEGEARVEFWMRHGEGKPGLDVEETGFILHPKWDYFGASPDGYIIENGIAIPLELKVPKATTHEEYLYNDVVPEEYIPQLQAEMICCDYAPYGYFASWCPPDVYPKFPDHMRLFVKRLEADQQMIEEIEEAATVTAEHVAQMVEKLQRMYPAKGAPKSKFEVEIEQSKEALDMDPNDFTGKAYAFLDEQEVVP